jgi:hypothetical protein
MLDKTKLLNEVGFHLLSSEVLNVTPELVKDFRAIPAAPTERELREERVTHLTEKIDRDLCVTFHWVTAEVNKTIKRINGQHSSTALWRVMANRGDENPLPKELKVHREHYKVDNDEWLAMLFRQFDDRTSGRTPLDISGVYQGVYPELAIVDRRIGKLSIDGYVWYVRFVEGAPVRTGDDVYSLFNDHSLYPVLLWINELLVGRCSEIKQPPIIAALIGTFMANESAARSFWRNVINVPGSEDSITPHSLLSDWLIQIKAGKIERPKPANIYQGCILAWNASRIGKTITTINDQYKKNLAVIIE